MTQALNLANHANFVNSAGKLDISQGQTGVLPIANGGTGLNITTPVTLKRFLGTGLTGNPTTLTQQPFSDIGGVDINSKAADGTNSLDGYLLTSNGTGGAVWAAPPSTGDTPGGVEIPNINFTVSSAGASQTFTDGLLAFYTSVNEIELLVNGVSMVPTEDYTFDASTDTLTVLVTLQIGDRLQVAPAFSGLNPIPTVAIDVGTSGANQVFNNSLFGLYLSAIYMEVLINGIAMVPGEDFSAAGNNLTIIAYLNAGDELTVAPSAVADTSTIPVWTSPTNIPVGGIVVGTSTTFRNPGQLFVGSITMIQGTPATSVNATWQNLGSLAATGNAGLWLRVL